MHAEMDGQATCAIGAEQGEDAAPRHVKVHAAQHAQLRVRLLKTPHLDRLDRLCCHRLCRHRDAPSLPVSSPPARSMALASRRSPVAAITGRDWLMIMVALLLQCRKRVGSGGW